MASKRENKLQGFVRDQLDEARARLVAFEKDAESVLKGLIEQGREQQRELEGLLQRLGKQGLAKELRKRATAAGSEVTKRVDAIQARVVEASGVATQAQVKQLNRELARLSKKIDVLVGKKPTAELRA